MTVTRFTLEGFTKNCVSAQFQDQFRKQAGCDVMISIRGDDGPENRIGGHSQVLATWSKRIDQMVREANSNRIVSPGVPLRATILCRDFGTIRLLMQMIYYGSCDVPHQLLDEFLTQASKFQVSFQREEVVAVTPVMKRNTSHWCESGTTSGDSGFGTGKRRQRKRGPEEIGKKDQKQEKRKNGKKRSSNDGIECRRDDEQKPCKRIRKKSEEMENQIQLSSWSLLSLNQGCDLLDLSIVPTIDSD